MTERNMLKYIIKLGGGENINREAFVRDLKNLDGLYLVIHGANFARGEIGKKMGYEVKTITSPQGYTSVRTEKEGMDIFMMAYAGLMNKRLVEMAQMNGINAIGLTGIDGGLIKGRRKKAIKAKSDDGRIKIIRDDMSGKSTQVNVDLLESLLDQGYVPFICPPILSEEGEALNTENNNIAATMIHQIPGVNTIIDLFEAPGLLKDVNKPKSLIRNLDKNKLEEAERRFTAGRMGRKMLAVREAFTHGVKRVIFADGRVDMPLTRALRGEGTIIE